MLPQKTEERGEATSKVRVAENYVPVDLWLHHQKYKEVRDEDPIYEIWRWMIPGKLKINMRTEISVLINIDW